MNGIINDMQVCPLCMQPECECQCAYHQEDYDGVTHVDLNELIFDDDDFEEYDQ